jgi:carbonic anhydrase/acetyltransferase-like protein (isoleucine patch superfamily)
MILNYGDKSPRIAGSAFLAASADVIGNVEIGERASVWFQCVLRGDSDLIRVGASTNIQDGSVVHTDAGAPALIGDWVTVGHRAVIHGCTIEDHCLIGIGAVILSHVRIGSGSIIAAGAVVPEKTVIPPRCLYMGVPARFRRELNDEDRAFIDAHAAHYLHHQETYMAGLRSGTGGACI